MTKFLSVLIAFLFASMSAVAASACPGKSVPGKVTITKIPHGNLKVVTMPISRAASKEFAGRVMGTVYEVGDTSPTPQPPTRAETKRFVRDTARELGIRVCRIS